MKRWTCFFLFLWMTVSAIAAPPEFLDAQTVVLGDPKATTPMWVGGSGAFSGEPELDLRAVAGGYRLSLDGGEPVTILLKPGGIDVEAPGTTHLYGLGEQFLKHRVGQTDLDWLGEERFAGEDRESDRQPHHYGNKMVKLEGGAVGNTQFPILYGYRPGEAHFAILVDNVYRHRWDFRKSPWQMRTTGGPLRVVVSMADDLPTLRRRYMSWVGRPPVPPRKAFGLWVSEYGYESWTEVYEKLQTLEHHGFPIDGFILDLQWFGGITEGSEESSMGKLTFETSKFPRPAEEIARLKRRGLGIIPIEEAYVAGGLPEHHDLASRGFLVKTPGSDEPHVLNTTPWWGVGGMLDYTSPEAGAYWHKTKRAPLIAKGVMGHWTDLGEPEMFLHETSSGELKTPIYTLGPQAAAHNLFNFLWSKSIFESYREHHPNKRPFLLSRSGTSGSQRFGVAMWSGDIGTNAVSLASHLQVQGQMSWSGVDYFGSDIGGFYRDAFEGSPAQLEDLYTRWFGIGCYTDVPVRPHTMNLDNVYETAPDRIGHRPSNLANIKERYRLLPYYYSLAHQAQLSGDPLVAPLAYWYPQVGAWLEWNRDGEQKLIGEKLMVVAEAYPDRVVKEVFLPAGDWYDFRTGEPLRGALPRLVELPLFDAEQRYRPPLLARAGALIPLDSGVIRVYTGDEGEFTLIEDDGVTTKYLNGERRLTHFSQRAGSQGWELRVKAAEGDYRSAPESRSWNLEVVGLPEVTRVSCNGNSVPFRFEAGRLIVEGPSAPVDQTQVFNFVTSK